MSGAATPSGVILHALNPSLGTQGGMQGPSTLQHSLGPADLRGDLARAAAKVQSIADGFPLPDYTRPVSKALLKAEERSQPYLREVERFERYR